MNILAEPTLPAVLETKMIKLAELSPQFLVAISSKSTHVHILAILKLSTVLIRTDMILITFLVHLCAYQSRKERTNIPPWFVNCFLLPLISIPSMG